jgi:hypothetical protein
MMDLQIRKFIPFWNKYRPAILKMMQATLNDWQHYQFMKHELDPFGKKPKGGFDFHVIIADNRMTHNVGDTEIARDLFNVLQNSQTGSSLLATNRYEIILDKKLALHISRQSLSEPTAVQAD